MAYSVTFTLSAGYANTTQADTFTIIGNHCNGSPAPTTIATGVALANLINGVTYQVADTISGGTITSTGTCTNQVPWTGQACSGGENPGNTAKIFEIERCVDNGTYYASDLVICDGSNTTLPVDNSVFIVGEYVQFYAASSCNGEVGATYCGEIKQVDVSQEVTALLSLDGILNKQKGCTNTECTQ